MYYVKLKILKSNNAFDYKEFYIKDEDSLKECMIFYKKNNCVIDELYELF